MTFGDFRSHSWLFNFVGAVLEMYLQTINIYYVDLEIYVLKVSGIMYFLTFKQLTIKLPSNDIKGFDKYSLKLQLALSQ